MSVPRFFVPDVPEIDPRGEIALPSDEAAHLMRVLRLGVGDEIAVFDGRGREFRARVARLRGAKGGDSAHVELIEPLEPAPEPRVRLTLAQAILKPDAMNDVVRDATMMGVARIDPIVSAHVTVKESAWSSGRAVERWRRVAVASAKQCRRAVVPDIAPPCPFEPWLADHMADVKIVLVEPAVALVGEAPSADAVGTDLASLADRRAGSAAILVGPEGGWHADERRQAEKAGFAPITLGRLTLRADATPIVGIALLRFVLRDL